MPLTKDSSRLLSARLAPIELLDSASGRRVRLGDLWKRRPAVLFFMRHFG